MRAGVLCVLVSVGVMGVLVDASADPETNSAPLFVEHKNTVSLNFGSYNIYKRNQEPALTDVTFSVVTTASPYSLNSIPPREMKSAWNLSANSNTGSVSA